MSSCRLSMVSGRFWPRRFSWKRAISAAFLRVGHYASYCRCVDSTKVSNGKRKGQGNVKNGNPYLAWAYMEAAQFAMRFSPKVQRFYQRKQAKSQRDDWPGRQWPISWHGRVIT